MQPGRRRKEAVRDHITCAAASHVPAPGGRGAAGALAINGQTLAGAILAQALSANRFLPGAKGDEQDARDHQRPAEQQARTGPVTPD